MLSHNNNEQTSGSAGDPKESDISRILSEPPLLNRSKFKKKETSDGRVPKIKPHGMGLQVPTCVDSEIPEEDARGHKEASGRRHQRGGNVEGEQHVKPKSEFAAATGPNWAQSSP